MTRPPERDEYWWDDYYARLDEGWSNVSAVQYANDIQDERLAEELAAEKLAEECVGDPLLKSRAA